MIEYRKKFIALDLETTHLDMREGKIMEVGACEADLYFDEKEKKVKVIFGKIFDKLVNPEILPPQTALALTGIKSAELEKALPWHEIKKDLEKFLADAVILGQNIVFDLDFLKNQGIRRKYPFVDTLDIALTFLPLWPVHSLEYLSQELGGKEGISHRALADCQNTASVLAGLMNEFLSFSPGLQKEIRSRLQESTISYRDLFLDLPQFGKSENQIHRGSDRASDVPAPDFPILQDWPDKTIVSLPMGFRQEEDLLATLARQESSDLAAVSHRFFLQIIPGEQLLPDPAWALCTKRLERFANQPNLSDPVIKVLIKLAIFKNTTDSLDLSLIKWGNLDRQIIPFIQVDPTVCKDHGCGYVKLIGKEAKSPRFLSLSGLLQLVFDWEQNFSRKRLLLFDLPRIEEEFVEAMTRIWNLRKIRKELMMLFPLEKMFPSLVPSIPKEVEEAVNELDLFFGILHLVYLKKDGEFAENFLINQVERNTTRFQKLFHPAEKLAGKLEKLGEFLRSFEAVSSDLAPETKSLRLKLLGFADFLKKFFLQPEAEFIYWLKFNSEWVDLNSCPSEAANSWEKFVSAFRTVTIVETERPRISFEYYKKRLGIESYTVSPLAESAKKQEFEVSIFKKNQTMNDLATLVQTLTGRTLVVVPNESKLTEFFEIFTSRENQKKEILAHRFSGNLTLLRSKLKKISDDGVLLLTLNVFLKNFQRLPSFANLILVRLPFEAPNIRPDLQAEGKNQFIHHVLPRSVTILHTIMSRFAAAASEVGRVYLLDNRILTEYDQTFLRYFEELPNTRISTV
ncbi:MAG: exonuclease domain-containing protein [bacterium]|nr:exonuclease domain-containing protein [bacterium]